MLLLQLSRVFGHYTAHPCLQAATVSAKEAEKKAKVAEANAKEAAKETAAKEEAAKAEEKGAWVVN